MNATTTSSGVTVVVDGNVSDLATLSNTPQNLNNLSSSRPKDVATGHGRENDILFTGMLFRRV